jgi:hypothetical protein
MFRNFTMPKGCLVLLTILIFPIAAASPPVLKPPSYDSSDATFDSPPPQAAEGFHYPEARYGKGELKYRNGLPVLVVAGTPEEIGEQTAVLAVKPGIRVLTYPEDVLRIFLKSTMGKGVSGRIIYNGMWGFFVSTANRMVKHFPEEYRTELESLIGKGEIDPARARVGNTMFDAKSKLLELRKGFGCSTLFVEGARSATGSPLYGRNLDFPSAGYLNEYSLVTVYRPTGKHAFVSVGFPGMIGTLSGMNDAGLTIAVLEVYDTREQTTDFDESGTPYALCIRKLLEDCTTVEEAEKELRTMKRTTLLNLAVGDRKHSAVFEFTPKSVVVRKAEEQLCACTNHFRTTELATSKACWRYDRLCDCEEKLDLEGLSRHLHSVSQGSHTLQTMIFEPEALRLHLAIGKCPSSALPMRTLELKELFKR